MLKYANEFAPHTDIMSVRCLHHEENIVKADGYLIEYNGQLWLLDGGMHNSEVTYNYLLSLRRCWLQKGGYDENCGIPLKMTWIVSHFHNDHISVALEKIIPDSRFEFDTMYLPPRTALDPCYDVDGLDGDAKYRPVLDEEMKKYGTGREKVVNVKYGKENVLKFSDESDNIRFTVYPPLADNGVGERLEYNIKTYWHGDRKHRMIPTVVMNSHSLWLKIEYGKTSFLFTGDTMKKVDDSDCESGDEMYNAYKDMIGQVDVVKFFHHGYVRDAGAGIIISFGPKHIITSCAKATASARIHSEFPDYKGEIHDCSAHDVIFETDGEKLEVRYDR